MERTSAGTSVGVDDPYMFVDRCDHLTDDGRCRLAAEHPDVAPEFAKSRRRDALRCPAADPDGEWAWADCPQFRCRNRDRECARCELTERRVAHDDTRPLLEEHHLAYRDLERDAHEITIYLCRWCHAKVHDSWARVTDDVAPDAEAMAAAEARRSRELDEASFETARERRDRE